MNWEQLGIESSSTCTSETIKIVEKKLNIKLPDKYKELVLFCDEAVPEVGCFDYDNGAGSCISEFFKFSDDEEQYSILWYYKCNIPELPKNIIPIARDAGDYLICLDYRDTDVPVVFYDTNEHKVHKISENFSSLF